MLVMFAYLLFGLLLGCCFGLFVGLCLVCWVLVAPDGFGGLLMVCLLLVWVLGFVGFVALLMFVALCISYLTCCLGLSDLL